MGKAGNSSVCARDMIWNELKRNNIENDRKKVLFKIDTCLREHEEIYGTVINRMDKNNLPMSLSHIYTVDSIVN